MNLYVPNLYKEYTGKEIQAQWPLWVDVECIECGKEQALSNAIHDGRRFPRCIRCGGICA